MTTSSNKDKGVEKPFNGYGFDDKKNRSKMKYLVIFRGDLDINGAYAFRSMKDLKEYIKTGWKEAEAVFEIKDITSKTNL